MESFKFLLDPPLLPWQHADVIWTQNRPLLSSVISTAVVDDPVGRSRTDDSATGERLRIHVTTSHVNNRNTRHVETQLRRTVYEQLT